MLICDVFQIKISTQNDTALHSTIGSSLHNLCVRVVLTHVTQRSHVIQKSDNQFNDVNPSLSTNTYVRVDVAECCQDCFLMTLKSEQVADKEV